jgi:hypothetical protein
MDDDVAGDLAIDDIIINVAFFFFEPTEPAH